MLDMVELPRHEPLVHPGDVLDDRYRVISEIAEGGMGTVYLVEHVLIKRRLALKLLHPALAIEADMVQRFMNEAHAAGTLGHPHIVEATDMGFTSRRTGDRIPFIVFEYLEGAQLSEEVYRKGPLPIVRALSIAKQIASALDTAHGAGIVHLDLKSDNILLTEREGVRDHVKVLDFGIARFMDGDVRTTRGLVMGTPEFMAPEQIERPDDVDRRADIYALGVLLYEMLAGRLPYASAESRILLYQICNEPPAPLQRPVPAALERMLFDRLLAKDRTQRFQSMKAAEIAIETVLGDLRSAELALPTTSDNRPQSPVRRRWMPLLGLATVAALAGAAGKYGEYRMHASAGEAARATLEADATHVIAAIDAQAAESRTRAATIARSPLVAALVTAPSKPHKPRSIVDLVEERSILPPRASETVEVFQLRKGKLVSALRLPATARPLEPRLERATRLVSEIDRVKVVATAPIVGAKGDVGLVAISTEVDLRSAQEQLARDALSATIVGLGREIDLVRPATVVEGQPIEATLAIDPAVQSAPLTLTAVVRARPRGRTFRTSSHVAFGTASILLLGFLAIRRSA